MSEFAITNILQNARDGISNGMTGLNYAHHAIHDGRHYFVESFTTMSDTQTYFVKWVTPDSLKQCHMIWDITSNGVTEGGAWVIGTSGTTKEAGTTRTVINNNQNSTKTSSMTFVSGADSCTVVGNKISEWKVGGTVFKGSIGGSGTRRQEIILVPGTTYQLKFTGGSTGNVVSYRAAWYEHAPNTGLKVAD